MSYKNSTIELATSPEQIEFDLNEIPKCQVEAICLAVSDLIERVRADPILYTEYLAWKANREKRRKKVTIPAAQ